MLIAVLAASAGPALGANDVAVEIHGVVWGNQAGVSDLALVEVGETVVYSFELDSTSFTDSTVFPIRGYPIDPATFAITFSGGVSVGIADPYPTGAIPMFVIRDNDPAVDGFFLSESVGGLPSAIHTDQDGVLGDFEARFNVSYTGDTLASLGLLDAVGEYDFTGLTVFGMGINDGFFEDVVGIDFSSMTISLLAPGCSAADLAEPFGQLDFSDVVAFLAAFGAQDPDADIAAPFGQWDFSDVVAFLSLFGSGCP